MSFFCLLWVPSLYLLRRSIIGRGSFSGSVWALLLGSITAILQFFLGYLVSPGGFGFSRYLFGFIDIVSLPIIIPLVIYFLMIVLRSISTENIDFANFAMLWLIPVAALRAIDWSSGSDPILLIVVPVLWTSLAIGIPFFIHWMINDFILHTAALSLAGILLLPITAAASYWAFFSHYTILGFVLLFIANIPLILSLTIDSFVN
jgi:hypothetical protein